MHIGGFIGTVPVRGSDTEYLQAIILQGVFMSHAKKAD
jgi:hypothetical protein